MSDKYFKNKAEEILKEIAFSGDWGKDKQSIYLKLKEVARDQRYACVDAVHKNAKKFPTFRESENQRIIESIIQNTNIEVKGK